MLIRLSLVFSLVQLISAGGTGCSACDSLKSVWNPDTNKGSCVGNPKHAVDFIIDFQKCICGPRGLHAYKNCTECNLDPTGGVPIDGLNFGPLPLFQEQCSMFKNDIDTILKPGGLAPFVSMFEPDSYMQDSIAEQDILAIEILSAIPSSVIAAATRTTTFGGSKATSGKTTPAPTDDGAEGEKTSDSGRILPTSILFSIVTLAVTAAIFL